MKLILPTLFLFSCTEHICLYETKVTFGEREMKKYDTAVVSGKCGGDITHPDTGFPAVQITRKLVIDLENSRRNQEYVEKRLCYYERKAELDGY